MNAPNPMQVTTPNDTDLLLVRAFHAPARLVYRAWVDPTLVPRWLGKLRTWQMVECQIDARVGGAYRYVWGDAEGRTMGVNGQFVELIPNEKIVSTEQFDDPWHEGDVVGTVTFAEQDGVTTVSMLLRYDSQRVRDEIVASNMARGIVSSYAALDEVLLDIA